MNLPPSRTISPLPIAAAVLAILFGALSPAANPPGIDSLVAKGVQFKTEKDGTVTEVSAGPKATIAVEDYALIGALHTLKQANISPEGARLDDETAAALAHLDQLEKFFANGAELND